MANLKLPRWLWCAVQTQFRFAPSFLAPPPMPRAFAQQQRSGAPAVDAAPSGARAPSDLRFDTALRSKAALMLAAQSSAASSAAAIQRSRTTPNLLLGFLPTQSQALASRWKRPSQSGNPQMQQHAQPPPPPSQWAPHAHQPRTRPNSAAAGRQPARAPVRRPASATLRRDADPAACVTEEDAAAIRLVQSSSAVRREQWRASNVDAAIAAAARPTSPGRQTAGEAAATQASSIHAAVCARGAAYEPQEIASAVPAEHRSSSAQPLYTGHGLPPSDRDHGFEYVDGTLHRAFAEISEAHRPRSPPSITEYEREFLSPMVSPARGTAAPTSPPAARWPQRSLPPEAEPPVEASSADAAATAPRATRAHLHHTHRHSLEL